MLSSDARLILLILLPTSSPSRNQSLDTIPLRMDHDETFTVNHTERDVSNFAIVFTVVDFRKHLTIENQSSINQVDASRLDDLLPLVFVPLELHSTSSSGITEAIQIGTSVLTVESVHY